MSGAADRDEEEFERQKVERGMVSSSTGEYIRTESWTIVGPCHGFPDIRPDTKAKIEALCQSSDPLLREFANKAKTW